MASSGSRIVVRKVKPLLSLDRTEAKKRVINLYKAWYRQAPFIGSFNFYPRSIFKIIALVFASLLIFLFNFSVLDYISPLTTKQIRQKIKDEFKKNAHVTDIRVIDMLVIKGQMELQETVKNWKQNCTIMYPFQDTANKKPSDFLSKFLQGVE